MSNLGEPPAGPGAPPSPPAGDGGDPRIGATFGKYRIVRKLGQGGMGAVYEGEDAALKRKVAVKFLPNEVLHKPEVIERFMREAQVTGRLNHPNIIAIYDVGKDERNCYMVMELLHPGSAASRVEKKGPYPWLIATRIIADCCAALKIAHEANIVHRDIKPENILFSQSGVVKLVDFGLVKLLEDDLHLTQTGMVCGTPLYMSPEQAKNLTMDARSDLYSLGATYYALLTGQPPFSGNGVPQILLSHVADPTPDPRAIVPDIPEGCVQVLMRAMEKKRDARYQSAGEMGADMETLLSGIPDRNVSIFAMETDSTLSTPRSGIGAALSLSFSGQSVERKGPSSHGGRGSRRSADGAPRGALSRRRFLALGGLGVAGLAGGGVYAVRSLRNRSEKGTAVKNGAAFELMPPIKAGILHSLSGPLAVSEHPLADASLLAMEELNARGGVLGRQIQPIIKDGKSEISANSAFTRAAEQLLSVEKVAVVFGGYGSAGRKAIRPFFEQHDQLLFYPAPYEGLEESQNIVYTGATPNQLAVPAINFCVSELQCKRFYLVGTDGLRPHAINAIVEDTIKGLHGEVVGTHYDVVGEFQLAAVVKKIEHAKPQIIINTLVGDSNVSFFEAMAEAGIDPKKLPVLSFAMGENELALLDKLHLAGHYVARARFQKIAAKNSAQDTTFEQRFKAKYGQHRPVSEIMEASYYGVLLWAAAVERAASEEVNKVRLALKEKEYELGEVRVRVDASNQHTWKVFEVGRIDDKNNIEVVKAENTPLPPIPFPGPRTRAEWAAFSEELYEQWGENWANPLKPHIKKAH